MPGQDPVEAWHTVELENIRREHIEQAIAASPLTLPDKMQVTPPEHHGKLLSGTLDTDGELQLTLSEVAQCQALLVSSTKLQRLVLQPRYVDPDLFARVGAIVQQIPNLHTLKVQQGRIPLVPEFLEPLLANLQGAAHLTALDLSGSGLDTETIRCLAAALPTLNVGRLSLTNNRVGTMGASHLYRAMPHLAMLRQLDLTGLDCREDGIAAIASHLSHLTNLETFSAGLHGAGQDDAPARSLALLIRGLAPLATSALKAFEHTSAGAPAGQLPPPPPPPPAYLVQQHQPGGQAAPASLAQLPSLTRLRLSMGAEYTVLPHYAPGLSAMRGLAELNLSGTRITAAAVRALAAALRALTALTELNVTQCALQPEHGALLVAAARNCAGMRHLQLGEQQLAFAALIPALAAFPQLETLGLNNTGLSEASVPALSAALSAMPALRHLQIEDNSLGDRGMALVALQLPRLPLVRSLSLAPQSSGNGVSSAGVGAIAAVSASLNQLTFLDLSNAAANLVSCDSLSTEYTNLSSLQTLCLTNLRLSADALAPVLSRLSLLVSLTHLNPSFNDLSHGGAAHLAAGLGTLTNLQARSFRCPAC